MNNKLTPDEQKTMQELAVHSFSQDALKQLAEQDFAEESHAQFTAFRAALKLLVADNTDPGSQEAQELAHSLTELNHRRAQGNPEIIEGMKKAWKNFNALPDEAKPKMYTMTKEEQEFITQACVVKSTQEEQE